MNIPLRLEIQRLSYLELDVSFSLLFSAFKGDNTTVLSDLCILVSIKGARVVAFLVGGFVSTFSRI